AERLEARLREKSPQDWQAYREFLDKKLALDTKEKQVEEELDAKEEELREQLEQLSSASTDPSYVSDILPHAALWAVTDILLEWKSLKLEFHCKLLEERRKKHHALKELKMSMESNIVLLEMDRRAMVDRLQKEVDQEKGKADAARERIRMLDEEITRAKAAMRRFRQEFEQLRVALLIDRMAKSTQ
ncbi:unnamed protein product, partial [Symbiodinium sp. KB8]